MSVKKLRRLPLAAAALAACVSAQAEYQSPDGNFRMSGFGTVGAVRNGTDDALFNYPGQGGGASKRGSLDPDSKLAVQGTYKITPTISGTVQVLTKYDAYGQYVPNVEWAFAKWQATPQLAFRAGRIGAPYFMISDFRDVGYANLTVRPSLDVYGQVPVSQFQGADAAYQFGLGSVNMTTTLWAGDSKANFASSLVSPPSEVLIQGQFGLNIQAEVSDGLTLRFGRSQGKLSINSDLGNQLSAGAQNSTLLQTLTALGDTTTLNALSQVNPLVNPSGAKATFTGIGASYDQDNWVFNGEYTQRKTDSFVSDTTGWYANVGYHINKFTPYVGFSKVVTNRRSSNPITANPYKGTALDLTQLQQGVDAVLGVEKLDQKTTTLGMRWDATSNVAVKVQLDHISKPADSNGMFLIPDPTAASAASFTADKRSINVVSLSVDFVF